ncbi:hypothetical protein H5410_064066 [Solanum commersonii]|uniref:Uncharacterized protein n=1 Tax=Solanum commersonii TaxID=4109 RepID=A0A9J5W0M2_SOLCO|nr:hypothetical protein H5410_064066 [Solanum commersonii]
MEPVGPQGLNGPLSRSNDPRRCPLRPYIRSQLALTYKTTHFLDQTIPRAGKSLFSRFSCTILSLTAKTTHLHGQTIIGVVFGDGEYRPYFCENFTWTSVKTLPMDPVGPHSQNDPFSGLNNPRIHVIFGDPEFRPYICKNFTWTSVKTLPIEPIGPHDRNCPFSRSNDPRSRILNSFLPKNFSWTSVNTLPMEPVGPHGQNGQFSRSNDPRSR